MIRRSVRLAVAALACGVATVAPSGATRAETTAADEPPAGDDPAAPDAGTESPAPAAPVPTVELAGGVVAALPSWSEAWTTWRYGRDGAGKAVDESSSRVRISGSGRTTDGMAVDFSVAIVAPVLRATTYGAAGIAPSEVLASVWARRERGTTTPDIAWEMSTRDARAGGLKLELTFVAEASHTSERRGGVTVDVTRARVHGTLEATLPCVRSQASARAACRPEILRGTF
jgi:hypothetical protein